MKKGSAYFQEVTPFMYEFEEFDNLDVLQKKKKSRLRNRSTAQISEPKELKFQSVGITTQGADLSSYSLDKRKIKLDPPPENKALYGCIRGYIQGHTSEKVFHKIVSCGKENCPTCGSDYSIVHNRRINRSYQKILQMERVGYLVVTTPDCLRDAFLCKKTLQDFRNFVRRKLKRDYNTRGLIRYHWCGDDCTTWKPHLNILMEQGYWKKEKLEKFRNEVAVWFTKNFKLSTPVAGNIYYAYQYSNSKEGAQKIRHWLNYVLRSTAKNVTDTAILDTIKGYNNTGYFGKFDKGVISRDAATAILAGADPDTGELICWRDTEIINPFSGELIKVKGGLIKPSIFNTEYRHRAREITIKKNEGTDQEIEISVGVYQTYLKDLVPKGCQIALDS